MSIPLTAHTTYARRNVKFVAYQNSSTWLNPLSEDPNEIENEWAYQNFCEEEGVL